MRKIKDTTPCVYTKDGCVLLGRRYTDAEFRKLIPNKKVRDAILRHGACGAPAYVFEHADGSGFGIDDANGCYVNTPAGEAGELDDMEP